MDDIRKKIALLIDYDNFNQEKYLPILFDELNEIGDVLIKYAFYSNLNDGTIREKFIKYGIEPMSQIAYTKGKNAVDIRMTIEAMNLLSKDYIDAICLATSDSDFTPLVYQLQKNNRYVIGAGDNKASTTYMNVFNEFISVEKISTPDEEEDVQNSKGKYIDKLAHSVDHIIDSNHDEEGYANFSFVINMLKSQMKDFSPKNYGAKNKQTLPFFKTQLKNKYLLKHEGTLWFIKRK
ncbi:MAG: NYN domain-containing protein [Acholeplasmataceae bacterium]